jgi:hypothetical protein
MQSLEVDPHQEDEMIESHENAPIDNRGDLLGRAAELAAHGLTATRALGGLALDSYIQSTPDYQSWRSVAAFAGLAITDAEGQLARWGRRRQGKSEETPRPLNSHADKLADKILINGTMKAIAKREHKNGNHIYAKAVDLAANITIGRDVATTIDSVVADIQHIDTRAQKAGKLKAVKQYLTVGFALSPLARSKPAKIALGLAFGYTAKESIKSGWSLHGSFTQKRRARRRLRIDSPELASDEL